MTYASRTDVPVDRSRAEIERTLIKYGATKFAYGTDHEKATIQFEAEGRIIRFVMKIPQEREFRSTAAYGQALRSRWRALGLVIKAKLEAVESEITTFEDEFLAYTVVPGGGTVSEWLQPQIETAYETGKAPRMLLELEA